MSIIVFLNSGIAKGLLSIMRVTEKLVYFLTKTSCMAEGKWIYDILAEAEIYKMQIRQ